MGSWNVRKAYMCVCESVFYGSVIDTAADNNVFVICYNYKRHAYAEA